MMFISLEESQLNLPSITFIGLIFTMLFFFFFLFGLQGTHRVHLQSEWVLLSAITSFAPPAMTSTAVTPLIDTASVNATRLVIYGGLSTSGPGLLKKPSN